MLTKNVKKFWNVVNPKTDDVHVTLIHEDGQPVDKDGCTSLLNHALGSVFTAEWSDDLLLVKQHSFPVVHPIVINPVDILIVIDSLKLFLGWFWQE